MRAMKSLVRKLSLRRLAIVLNTSSPAACPIVSLMAFEIDECQHQELFALVHPLHMRGNHFIETGSVWKSREGIRSCRRTQRKFDFVLVSNTRGDIEKDFDVERNIIHNRALRGNQCRNDRAVGVPDIDLLQHIASILREHAMSAITCRAADGSPPFES